MATYHSCNYNGVIFIMARISGRCKGESALASRAARVAPRGRGPTDGARASDYRAIGLRARPCEGGRDHG